MYTRCVHQLLHRRMTDQMLALYKDKAYGRAAVAGGKDGGLKEGLEAVIAGIPAMFAGVNVKPALLHGDLWIGNVGGTPEGACCFDPARWRVTIDAFIHCC
jgi:protein-ribulosamine 3-kinase